MIDHVLGVLRAPALAELWLPPPKGERVEVWRERAFEIVLDGVWVSGVFDRVHVQRDASGQARAATVWDFKTDAVTASPAELERALRRHEGQLNLYRRVAGILAGLPPAAVRAEVVFTAAGRRVPVDAGV